MRFQSPPFDNLSTILRNMGFEALYTAQATPPPYIRFYRRLS